jgi:hypothetical protein
MPQLRQLVAVLEAGLTRNQLHQSGRAASRGREYQRHSADHRGDNDSTPNEHAG